MLISQDKNSFLMRPIEMKEVEDAIKIMEGGTSPGPYGFTIKNF